MASKRITKRRRVVKKNKSQKVKGGGEIPTTEEYLYDNINYINKIAAHIYRTKDNKDNTKRLPDDFDINTFINNINAIQGVIKDFNNKQNTKKTQEKIPYNEENWKTQREAIEGY